MTLEESQFKKAITTPPMFESILILLPALCVALMVSLTHVPFGFVVLRSQIIFLDLAIAQACALGILIANFLGIHNIFIQQSFALFFAFLSSSFFYLAEKKIKRFEESIIGVVYIFNAVLYLLIASQMIDGKEHFDKLLAGEILFVTWNQVLLHTPLYVAVFLSWVYIPRIRQGFMFYILFSILISSSVQLIGIYLVFASLVVTPLAALLVNLEMKYAYILSLLSIFLGLFASYFWDLPSAPTIVISIVGVSLLMNMLIIIGKAYKKKYKLRKN